MYTTSLPPANKIVKPTPLKLAVKLNIHYNISNMGIVRSFDLEQFTDPTTSNVVVVSGPSGAGKGTLISAAQDDPELSFAWPVSSTTRGMRPGEAHGSEYDFVGVPRIKLLRDIGALFELEAYDGNFYGSPHPQPLIDGLSEVATILYELESKGAQSLLDTYPALWIAVVPPSTSELEVRLRERGTNSEKSINKRLTTWINEEEPVLVGGEGRYSPHITIVNDDLSTATSAFIHAIRYGALPEST